MDKAEQNAKNNIYIILSILSWDTPRSYSKLLELVLCLICLKSWEYYYKTITTIIKYERVLLFQTIQLSPQYTQYKQHQIH